MECHDPDDILGDIGEETAGELVDEDEEKKRKPVVIAPDLRPEKKEDLDKEPQPHSQQPESRKGIAERIGNGDLVGRGVRERIILPEEFQAQLPELTRAAAEQIALHPRDMPPQKKGVIGAAFKGSVMPGKDVRKPDHDKVMREDDKKYRHGGHQRGARQ